MLILKNKTHADAESHVSFVVALDLFFLISLKHVPAFLLWLMNAFCLWSKRLKNQIECTQRVGSQWWGSGNKCKEAAAWCSEQA